MIKKIIKLIFTSLLFFVGMLGIAIAKKPMDYIDKEIIWMCEKGQLSGGNKKIRENKYYTESFEKTLADQRYMVQYGNVKKPGSAKLYIVKEGRSILVLNQVGDIKNNELTFSMEQIEVVGNTEYIYDFPLCRIKIR